MGYPERLLSEGEVIETEFRPHWSGLIREGLLLLGGIAVMILLAVLETSLPWWVYVLVLGFVVAFTLKGVITHVTTHHVITNERVIYRAGFIAKRGKEIPLEVINDVAFNQTIFEKVFGTGDLMIESAGTHGQTRYRDIPTPEGVQSLLYRVREDRILLIKGGGSGPAATSESSASQLERLSRLHDDGKLSDEEFEREKNRILGDS